MILRLLTRAKATAALSCETMTMRLSTSVALGALVAACGACHADAQPPSGRHVRASLVAELDSVRPGEPLAVAFRLQMDPGWHTYWRNPGDAGLATKVIWELPEGLSAGELQWPRPMRFRTGPLVSYGYEHEVVHPVEIGVPAALKASEIRLVARLSWLECQEACLPGKANLELALPVRSTARATPEAPLFAAARRDIPREDPEWTFGADAGEGAIDLTVRPPRDTALSEAYFYPIPRRVLDYSKPQPLSAAGGGYRLELSRDRNGAPAAPRLAGVLVARTSAGEKAVAVDVPVRTKAPARSAGDRAPGPEKGKP